LQGDFGLQPLIGKLLATINDARFSRRTDATVAVERLLSITGCDPISANRKNMVFWEGQLQTRFLVLSNELPHFIDSSAALISRFIVVQFTQSWLGKEDPSLEERLGLELPGILNWALEGYRRLHERGRFEQPPSGLDAIRAMEDLASPVKAFVRDCCLIGPNYVEEVQTLYAYWEIWCDAHGRRYPGTVQAFGRQLRAACQHIRMKQHPRRYTGIAVDHVARHARADQRKKRPMARGPRGA
jgi:putative DNA primase/helicase